MLYFGIYRLQVTASSGAAIGAAKLTMGKTATTASIKLVFMITSVGIGGEEGI